MSQLAKVRKITAFINKKTKNFKPEIALITGSGLAGSVPELKNKTVIPYKNIPDFLNSTVSGHSGNLIFGTYKGKKLMVMQGRFHYYEGHCIKDIALAPRVMGMLGVKTLMVSAAVGSINAKLTPGSLAVLSDHINLMATNPLIGNYDPAFGQMFVDLSEAYDKKLVKLISSKAKKLKINNAPAVYIAVTGPNFETPSEIKAFRTLGADVVGMSVVHEVIASRQAGIKVCGCAWVTNLASGISKTPLSHAETLSETKKIEGKFKTLLENVIPEM
ncbi:Inosine guanosine and xanthosine phosphorylase family [Elusimicrobium minutum Pei191]|uniref:Purine nucleoside phosphorylase n=1 Tax=Elusimicrobium minutum (strain Pei191) TaxID=445932 RepID=B2KC58_ELUMP|nr:purine-nucleoside phosphorylase [Elusimicrobium minutum]ACC98185.1 Inosine guanosine and xanthosine phosphorylase family [Elusimicrobium minutum Pei191]